MRTAIFTFIFLAGLASPALAQTATDYVTGGSWEFKPYLTDDHNANILANYKQDLAMMTCYDAHAGLVQCFVMVNLAGVAPGVTKPGYRQIYLGGMPVLDYYAAGAGQCSWSGNYGGFVFPAGYTDFSMDTNSDTDLEGKWYLVVSGSGLQATNLFWSTGLPVGVAWRLRGQLSFYTSASTLSAWIQAGVTQGNVVPQNSPTGRAWTLQDIIADQQSGH
jgi:hypothetical protein